MARMRFYVNGKVVRVPLGRTFVSDDHLAKEAVRKASPAVDADTLELVVERTESAPSEGAGGYKTFLWADSDGNRYRVIGFLCDAQPSTRYFGLGGLISDLNRSRRQARVVRKQAPP